MDNFTAIRNGILEHIQEGKLCPFDLGIYVFLHLRADWSTGIYHGCALGIAHAFNEPSLKHHINKSLIRLRERRYINYPKGCGRRGGYEVLIHKYHVTVGEQSGMRLNAWKHGELCKSEYEQWNGYGTVGEQSRNSGGTVEEPIQDLKTLQDVKTRTKTNGASAPSLPDWIPADAWEGFVEMRKKVRAPLTNRAITLVLGKLEKLRAQGHDPAALLDEAVEHSWKSVYAPTQDKKPNPTYRERETRAETAARLAREKARVM